MAPKVDYRCTRCGVKPQSELETEGEPVSARELLTVKKVSFLEMGAGGRSIRSRVLDWLCPVCVAGDPDFQLPEYEQQRTERG